MSNMSNRPSLLVDRLNNNDRILATFTVLKGVRNAQILAHTGVDAVVVDCEHGMFDDTDMHDAIVAISSSGSYPLIRARSGAPETIMRALDTGTHGLIIPMVNTAQQARDIVTLSKFPPGGTRGQGGPFACFHHGFDTPRAYVEKANDQVVLIMQIETREGVDNIKEICQVKGVDMVLIGPNDLALSLLGRHPAESEDVEYHDAVNKVVDTAHRAGIKAGFVVVDGQTAVKAFERFDFVIMTNEVRALQAWYRAETEIARGAKA